MKKKISIFISILIAIILSAFIIIKFNPPLETGSTAWGENKKFALVEIGNSGFQGIKIKGVTVNDNQKPFQTKIQKSNILQGLIVTDDFHNAESQKYNFLNLNDVTIKAGTSLESISEKLNNESRTEQDDIYGISVISNSEIRKVNIKYSYFGMMFSETVVFN